MRVNRDYRSGFQRDHLRCDLAELVHEGGTIDRNRAAFILRGLPASPAHFREYKTRRGGEQYGLSPTEILACKAFTRTWLRLLAKVAVNPALPFRIEEERVQGSNKKKCLCVTGSQWDLENAMLNPYVSGEWNPCGSH